eukprot:g38.t1
MVFVTNSLPDYHLFSTYDNFTLDAYERERAAGGGASAALFFSLPNEEHSVTSVTSHTGLTGRFVLLKLISSHREHNIDVEYIGFYGSVDEGNRVSPINTFTATRETSEIDSITEEDKENAILDSINVYARRRFARDLLTNSGDIERSEGVGERRKTSSTVNAENRVLQSSESPSTTAASTLASGGGERGTSTLTSGGRGRINTIGGSIRTGTSGTPSTRTNGGRERSSSTHRQTVEESDLTGGSTTLSPTSSSTENQNLSLRKRAKNGMHLEQLGLVFMASIIDPTGVNSVISGQKLEDISHSFFGFIDYDKKQSDSKSTIPFDISKSAIQESLHVLSEMLGKLEPLQLYSEWAPPEMEEDEELDIHPLDVFSSRAYGKSNGPERAVLSDYGHWRSSPTNAASYSYWGVSLSSIVARHTSFSKEKHINEMDEDDKYSDVQNGIALSSISVDWHGRWKPAVLHIECSQTDCNRILSNRKVKQRAQIDPLHTQCSKNEDGEGDDDEVLSSSSLSSPDRSGATTHIGTGAFPIVVDCMENNYASSTLDNTNPSNSDPENLSFNMFLMDRAMRESFRAGDDSPSAFHARLQETKREWIDERDRMTNAMNERRPPMPPRSFFQESSQDAETVEDVEETTNTPSPRTLLMTLVPNQEEGTTNLGDELPASVVATDSDFVSDSDEDEGMMAPVENGEECVGGVAALESEEIFLDDDEMKCHGNEVEKEEKGEEEEWITLLSLPASRLDEPRYILPHAIHGKQLRLRMEGYAQGNTELTYAIEKVQLRRHVRRKTLSSMDCIDILQRWLTRVIIRVCSLAIEKKKDIFDDYKKLLWDTFHGIERLAIATGSLCNIIHLIEAHLYIYEAFGDDPLQMEDKFLSQINEYLNKEKEEQRSREESERKSAGTAVGKSASNVLFDPLTASHPGLVITEGGMSVSCTTGSNASILLDIGFTSGKAAWEFELAEDTTSQCTCFGAATKPVSNHNYERSPDLWMYRAYNGYLYNRGTRDRTCRRIYKGDIVRCELDMDEGTLQYLINGEDQGIAFTNMNQFGEVFPAVAFYSSGRAVRLLKVECMGARLPKFLIDMPIVDAEKISTKTLEEGKKNFDEKIEDGETVDDNEDKGKEKKYCYDMFDDKKGVLRIKEKMLDFLSKKSDVATNESGNVNEKGDDANVGDGKSKEKSEEKNENNLSNQISICVQGKKRKKSILMLPPAGGTTCRCYRLGKKFDTFVVSVGLNDSAFEKKNVEEEKKIGDESKRENDDPLSKLTSIKVNVSFEVKGDGKSLWKSNDVTARKQMEQCSIKVVDIELIELIVNCKGSNEIAHAIWIDPALIVETSHSIWFRKVYGSVGVDSLPPIDMKLNEKQISKISTLTHARLLMESLNQLGDIEMRRMRRKPPVPLASWEESSFDLESPFIVQVNEKVFCHIEKLLRKLQFCIRRSEEKKENDSILIRWSVIIISLLKILAVNFRRLECSYIDPAQAGFALSKRAFNSSVLPQLKKHLDFFSNFLIDQTIDSNSKELSNCYKSIRQASIEAAYCGRRFLIPSSLERVRNDRLLGEKCRVVEVEVCWPVFDSLSESSDGSTALLEYERLLLLLLMECRRCGWNHCFMGEWMRIAYLVIEVPSNINADTKRNNNKIKLLGKNGKFQQNLRKAGFEKFRLPLGDRNKLPVRIEISPCWNRTERLAYNDLPGCIHLYLDGEEQLFEQVCNEIKKFKPWKKK